jgi:hypothetical protein
MTVRKDGVTKKDLQGIREEIVQQFHIISEDIISQVQQVAEGVSNVNEKLDRTHQELKTELQENRQEVLTAIKLSYTALDKRISTSEKEVGKLKRRVEKREDRPLS